MFDRPSIAAPPNIEMKKLITSSGSAVVRVAKSDLPPCAGEQNSVASTSAAD